MDRSPRFTVVLPIIMMVSVACASARLDYASPEQQVEETMAPGVAEEDLRQGASHPWAEMVIKVCLAFVVCYYGFRMLADTYLMLHTLSASLARKRRSETPSGPDVLTWYQGDTEVS